MELSDYAAYPATIIEYEHGGYIARIHHSNEEHEGVEHLRRNAGGS